jgi:cytochrome P450
LYEPFGAWVLTRYNDVDAALRDLRLSSTLGEVVPPSAEGTQGWQALRGLYSFVNNSLVFSDQPRHTRLRELVSKAFTPRAVESMRARIQTLVDGMLDAAQPRGQMDLIRELAYPLPLAVIASMLGLAQQDRDRLKQWCDDFILPFGRDPTALSAEERERVDQGSAALVDYVHRVVEEVRGHPNDALVSALEQAAEAGDRLSDDELFANVVLLIIAGHENLTSLLGIGTLALLQNPDQLQRARDDAGLWPRAVEELVRYVTPNQFIRRRAREDVVIGGKTVATDQFVLLVLAAANRDPARFPDPDRLDFARPPTWHVAFGHGIHYCLGAPLARLEGEIVFETLFRRFPALRLTTDHWDYVDNFNVRQLKALPVAF